MDCGENERESIEDEKGFYTFRTPRMPQGEEERQATEPSALPPKGERAVPGH